MHWITEDPTWLIALGVLFEGALAIALVRSGRAVVLGFMMLVAALVVAGLGVERMIVTPREEVEQALDGVAAALEANNLPRLLSYLAPEARELRDVAESHMRGVHFTEAKIRNLKVTINRFVNPPTAKADFWGAVSMKDDRGQAPYEHYVDRFVVQLRHEGDRWLLTGYERRSGDESLPWQKQGGRRER